jgi:ABC-type polysaccharide/polyol phosphate transport system ATPase subunit
VARVQLDPTLENALEFESVSLTVKRTQRRTGGGRRDRLRRMASETVRVPHPVILDISLDIAPGECVGVLGEGRDAGVIELLRLSAGTLIPDHGQVRRRDVVVPILRRVGLVNANMTVRQNIYVIGILLGMSPEQITAELPWIVDVAALGKVLDTYARTCPNPLRRRIAWTVAMATRARTFAIHGALIMGDEQYRDFCWSHVEALKADGVTFLVADQEDETMLRFCERGLVLENGRVIADTTMAEALSMNRRRAGDEDTDSGADENDLREDIEDW